MKSTGSNTETALETNRIEALSDGIFAITMTLLVLTLDLPEAAGTASTEGLAQLLRSRMHKLSNYALSFILLGIFWLAGHISLRRQHGCGEDNAQLGLALCYPWTSVGELRP